MKKEKIKKWNGNSGFSLVELIIVVAIMAILIGVLAPQYMKYVERSRRSTDMQNVAAVATAIQVYSSDPEVAATDRIASGENITITTTAYTDTAGAHITAALEDAGITVANLRLQSTSWNTNAGSIVITATVDADGAVTVTADDTDIGLPETPAAPAPPAG